MEDLFRQFWWLIFPLAWIVGGMVTSFLNYRRQQKTLDLIKAYADKGQEPPAALMKVLDRPIDSDTEFWQGRSSRLHDRSTGPSRPVRRGARRGLSPWPRRSRCSRSSTCWTS